MKWWRAIVQLVRGQLTQGATPEGLALACAVGVMMGNFPVMGTTTILCAFIGIYLRLNQPVLQLANYMMLIPQLVMLPIFLRLGETLTGSEHLTLNPQELLRDFMMAPLEFFRSFGIAGAHAVLAWILIAPLMGLVTYFVMQFIFRRALKVLPKRRDPTK